MRYTDATPWQVRELLTAAKCSAQSGLHLPAGVFGRIGLEHHLRLLCKAHNLRVKRPSHAGIPEYSGALYRERLISKDDHSEVKRLSVVGNKCCHNAGVHWFEVDQMLDRVGGFVDRVAIDLEQLEFWGWIGRTFGQEGGTDD